MIDVEIKYRLLGFMRSFRRKIPTTMGEMNEAQMLAVTSLYLKKVSTEEFVRRFFGIPLRIIRRMESFHLYHLIALVDFTRGDGHMNRFAIPELPGIGKAPEENLRDMSFEQFMLADTHFSAYAVHKRPESLDGMITALYAFDHITDAGKMVGKISLEHKMAVFFNWVLIKRWLSIRFPLVFPEGDSEVKEPQVVQWLPIFDSFVGDDVAHIYDYKKLQVMDVLRIMNKRIKDYHEKMRKSK